MHGAERERLPNQRASTGFDVEAISASGVFSIGTPRMTACEGSAGLSA
jgi:hypothetical protein